MKLKYGMNPNQDFAEIKDSKGLELLGGTPSIINILDALNSWQLVKELGISLNKSAAASFKHVSPSGAALEGPLGTNELKACNYSKIPESPLAEAYLKARGADRLASFGDFIALNQTVDTACAALIRSEVSDGIIAPAYNPEAMEILKQKKKGKYIIFAIDPAWEPPELESRDIYGITVTQKRNNIMLNTNILENIVCGNKPLPASVQEDLLLGLISLKYTQSNSISVVWKGRTIGIGAGQQSRILCSELALGKANKWYQKTLLEYSFMETAAAKQLKKTDKDLLIDEHREKRFGAEVVLNRLEGVCLCSDAFFPQTDNIRLAAHYGVQYIAAPMGSVRDSDILAECDKAGITFINTGIRLFHH